MKIPDAPPNALPPGKTPFVEGKKTDAPPQLSARIELSPGQLLKGRVTGVTEDGRVQLNVAGHNLSARSLVPLTQGRELWFEVSKGGNLPLLNLAGKKGVVQEFLKLFLTSSTLSTSAQKQLLSEISLLSGNPNLSPADKTMLTSIVSANQGSHPSPQAIKILAALLTGPETVTAKGAAHDTLPLYNSAKQLLTAHQEINTHPPIQDNQNFYLFPCFFSGQNGWGEWLFSLEKQKQTSEENYTLSFFLELSNLGPLTLMASIQDKTIHGEFRLQTEKTRNHLASSLDSLTTALKNQGYTSVQFSCFISNKELIGQFKETLEKKTATERFTLVDIKV